jgi:hypothetical protein
MEGTPRATRTRRALAGLERVFPWIALVAAAAGLFIVLTGQREGIAAVDSIGWTAVVPSALALMLAPLMQGASSYLVLRQLTGRTSPLEAIVVWSRSYIVRYAPTGTLAVAYRVSSRRRVSASTEQVVAAFTYEHVAVPAAASVLVVVLFPLSGALPPLGPLAIALATLALTAAMRPGIAGRAVETLARRLRIQLRVVLGGRQVATLVSVNAVGWLGTGVAVYLIVVAMTGDRPPFLWLTASYAAAYLLGFMAPLSPGGLGVREGVLVVLLGPIYGIGVAAAIAVVIRLANVAGELMTFALVHALYATHLVASRIGDVAVETERVATR